MRAIGIDVGSRRIGVAASDDLGMTAQPLVTLETGGSTERAADLVGEICRERGADTVVVGLPLSLDGGDRGAEARRARAIGEALEKRFGVEVVYRDERFTTAEAERLLVGAGVRRKQRRGARDRIAASLILQGYLDGRRKRDRET